jgi:hypothetical protein
MEHINWTNYLAADNLDGVNRVLEKYGYPIAMDYDEAIDAIPMLMDSEGENATMDLIKEHPDYDIIISDYTQNFQFANADGDLRQQVTNTHTESVSEIPAQVIPQILRQVSPTIPSLHNLTFSATLQNIILVVMTFWLINKIISDGK